MTISQNINDRSYEAAWKEAVKIIASKQIKGLQVQCPRCYQTGTLISKWIKKSPIKPLYVVHYNGNGEFRACQLCKGDASILRQAIRIRSKDVLKTIRMGKTFVLFSGGKDSLCLLEYMRRLSHQSKREITVLHVDTTAGFPEVEAYVHDVCKTMELPLIVVRPNHNYFDIAKKWGIPGVKSRWCCKTLKIDPLRRFLKDVQGPKVVFDGIRAAESNIRATYVPVWFHPSFRCVSVSPIFFWSDKKIYQYIEENDLPIGPAAELGGSAECWCGAYKSRSDFEALLRIKPDIFDKLVEVEEAQGGKYTFIYEKGEQVPLSSLNGKKGGVP